jgi:hypothetical protein
MNYSLGNMLSRGGALNPDGLSLDLQFAADKTLTARRGPTPTFTRASTATFVGSNGLIQTAAINAPRFDHDPVTLASRGLLIEESRTNVVPNSQGLANWSFTNSTLGSATTAPDGSNTANSVSFQTANSSPLFYSFIARLAIIAVTAGQQYTLSFYVKSATNTSINIGVNGRTQGANNSGILVNVTTSWTRVSFTTTLAVNDTGLFAVIGTGMAGSAEFLSARNIEIWGAQLEAGSFPTSYIPTTTASVVRSADVCSITGSDFSGMYNQTGGSILADCIFYSPTSNPNGQRIWEITDRAFNFIRSFRAPSSGLPDFRSTSSGSLNVIITGSSALLPFQVTKHSYGFANNDYVFYMNNSQVGVDNLGSLPVDLNSMYIGVNSPSIGAGQINGTIASLSYYRKRLPNAKLQSLTA